MRLMIKGAFYYDRDAKTVLVPHYTGEYNAVDCDKYVLLDELKVNYPESYIEDVIENNDCIVFENKEYYYAQYSPWCNLNELELLSDVSELQHIENNYDF